LCQQCLAGSRRAYEQQSVFAGGGYLQGALAGVLAANLGEICRSRDAGWLC